MGDGYIDLHCHSTASDGRLTPAELVETAVGLNLKALALTDHDTVAGVGPLIEAAHAVKLETVNGVEVSARFDRGSMHIVGLFVDISNRGFLEFLGKLSEGRRIRNPKILAKLAEHGLDVSMEEVEEEAGLDAGGGGAVDKSVGRPHIASVMINKGYVKDKSEAFDKYLAKGQSCYVSRFVASPEETIRQIHAAKGLAILAHPPYLKASSEEELESLIRGLKEHGLDGIEVHYSTHTKQQTEMCLRFAEKLDLVPSGGSDFHGEPASDGQGPVELGTGIRKNLKVPYSILTGLKERWSRVRA